MILIAESGSTKTNWLLKKEDGTTLSFETMGFNPLFINGEEMKAEIEKSKLFEHLNSIREVYFYGASCSSPSRNEVIEIGLRLTFPNVSKTIVDHDMKAACIGLLGDKKGIACIIGTGSNSCVWDGQKITDEIAAPGYVLGDEASGAYFGKIILRDYLYHRLPDSMTKHIKSNFVASSDEIYRKVYSEKFPNRFLASYAVLLSEFRNEAYSQKLLSEGFDAFIQYHILPYNLCHDLPVGFVGSIAHVFKEELKAVCTQHQIQAEIFVKSPIDSLLAWHTNSN